MKQETEPNRALTSFLPVLILGGLTIFLLQYFQTPEKKSPQPGTAPLDHQSPAGKPETGPKNPDLVDFTVRGGAKKAERIQVDTGFYRIILNSQGGRIEALYLKSHDELTIPAAVIKNSQDPIAMDSLGVEVTRGNGMDFQPFLYLGNTRDYQDQLAVPALNSSLFQLEGPLYDERSGIHEVRFVLPVTLKKKRLEIVKIFRFFRGENFFRQITVLRNTEKENFEWPGWLFFKPFGDIGPAPEDQNTTVLATYGRFHRNNGELHQRPNLPPSRSFFSFLSCSKGPDPDRVYSDYPEHMQGPGGTTEFIGSNSRYFFTYANFLTAGEGSVSQRPDGVVYRNHIDPTGKEALTAVYRNFRLGARQDGAINVGSVAGNQNQAGAWRDAKTGNAAVVRDLQKRPDALVIDSQVYLGVKSDESHRFRNTPLFEAEFGSQEPNPNARSVIYQNAFLGLFSRIRDWIVILMRIVYGAIGNYGWTIILIATTFKLATWPLNQMQAKSAKKMSALKPEMDRLNEKYADDPQEKQKKVMELWKKHNINPAKGCLPILIQMPIFIALYSAFSESVELWHSPFILWMKDLSRPDTIFVLRNFLFINHLNINILPLLMAGTQVGAQLTTTMTVDPQQKMMMYLLPVVFIFVLWDMPSGVTLYWTIQNIITIFWQFANNYLSKDEDVPA